MKEAEPPFVKQDRQFVFNVSIAILILCWLFLLGAKRPTTLASLLRLTVPTHPRNRPATARQPPGIACYKRALLRDHG